MALNARDARYRRTEERALATEPLRVDLSET